VNIIVVIAEEITMCDLLNKELPGDDLAVTASVAYTAKVKQFCNELTQPVEKLLPVSMARLKFANCTVYALRLLLLLLYLNCAVSVIGLLAVDSAHK
jgi:hypothetical protein